jgi:hypothetical protein
LALRHSRDSWIGRSITALRADLPPGEFAMAFGIGRSAVIGT